MIVNRVHRRQFDASVVEPVRAAARRESSDEAALLACVAERAAEESGWSEINATYLARLRAGIGDAPVVELPFLFVEEFGRDELDQLSRLLEAGMGARAEVPVRRRTRSSS